MFSSPSTGASTTASASRSSSAPCACLGPSSTTPLRLRRRPCAMRPTSSRSSAARRPSRPTPRARAAGGTGCGSASATATGGSRTAASPSGPTASSTRCAGPATGRPSVLFDRATAWLIAAEVLLPGLSVLERAVARVRARAADHLFRRLTAKLTPEQRTRLDALVAVSEGARSSPLDRLRDGPFIRSGPEIGRAVRRLEEIRAIGCGLPEIDRLPPGKVTALARFASAARARGRWRVCPTTGARRRCWPWCARWRPRPPTT